jgi:hypothetical protein
VVLAPAPSKSWSGDVDVVVLIAVVGGDVVAVVLSVDDCCDWRCKSSAITHSPVNSSARNTVTAIEKVNGE